MKMCNRAVLILYLLFLSGRAKGQAHIKQFVTSNTHLIHSIDPGSADLSDLDVIGAAIGDARIVMLGEQDHGDAPTYLAKTLLIKYLHERKGFNVLAFESDFFGLNYFWPLVKEGRMGLDSFLRGNIFPVWLNCKDCQSLFRDYLPKTLQSSTPLQITGFDNTMNTRRIFPLLDSVLRKLDLPICHQSDYNTRILPFIREWYKYTADSINNKKDQDILADIRSQMLSRLDDHDFWVIVMDNLIQLSVKYNNLKRSNYWKEMNTRDRQMAANLKWLAYSKYQNEKIIVWAHNYHVSKYSGHFPEPFMNEAMSMGTLFTNDPSAMSQTYVIGFTSYEGRAGRLGLDQYKVQRPPRNSFENWGFADHPYAFVDFTPYNKEHPGEDAPFYMSGSVKTNMLHTNSEARWNKLFDGVFFIRDMYPCEAVSKQK